MEKHIGVSGTRKGMSKEQIKRFSYLLDFYYGDLKTTLHHGDCIGVDEQSHKITEELGFKIIVHPPLVSSLRAWCKNYTNIRPKENFLKRNWHIAQESETIFIIPKEYTEELIGSGTWATYRYARKLDKKIIIIYPDGSVWRNLP